MATRGAATQPPLVVPPFRRFCCDRDGFVDSRAWLRPSSAALRLAPISNNRVCRALHPSFAPNIPVTIISNPIHDPPEPDRRYLKAPLSFPTLRKFPQTKSLVSLGSLESSLVFSSGRHVSVETRLDARLSRKRDYVTVFLCPVKPVLATMTVPHKVTSDVRMVSSDSLLAFRRERWLWRVCGRGCEWQGSSRRRLVSMDRLPRGDTTIGEQQIQMSDVDTAFSGTWRESGVNGILLELLWKAIFRWSLWWSNIQSEVFFLKWLFCENSRR